MSFLRRDPSTRRWVVFSESGLRETPSTDRCPFCEGNEDLTPPEIIRWERNDDPGVGSRWAVRVIPNAEPLLRVETPLARSAEGMYDAASGTGAHEIIVETPEHRASLAGLSTGQVARVLLAYAQRIQDLKRDRRLRSIFIFKNQGFMAGAGLPGHAHSQLIALPVTPKALKEILQGARLHYQVTERCVFCDILRTELDQSLRVVEATDRFVAFAPYASRHPFETWILPRAHEPDFETTDPEDLKDLGGLLIAVLGRIERTLPEPAYNLFLYSGPNRAAFPDRWKTLDVDFHWHIQILPRLVREAGFEVGSGFYANPVVPERAAAALRLNEKWRPTS